MSIIINMGTNVMLVSLLYRHTRKLMITGNSLNFAL